MKPLVLMLYPRLDEINSDILEKILNSCNRREMKLNYSIILNACVEKELNYLPEIKPSRRDLLRRCQSRSAYCRGIRIHVRKEVVPKERIYCKRHQFYK
jgi:hypothetical protein